MASAHGLFLIKDLTINNSSTGLYSSTGGQLVTANIVGSGNYAYSNTFILSPKSKAYFNSHMRWMYSRDSIRNES